MPVALWRSRLLLIASLFLLTACARKGLPATAVPARPDPTPAPTPANPELAQPTGVSDAEAPDLILHNGVLLTMVEAVPRAQAVAVDGERILAIGSDEQVLSLAGARTRLVDLQGRTLMPGFVDAHTHLFNDHEALGTDLAGAQVLALRHGITTLANMYTTEGFIQEMRAFEAAGKLLVRTSLYLSITTNCGEPTGDWWKAYSPTDEAGERLRIAGLKAFADGGTCGEIAASEEILPGYGRGELFFSDAEMQAMFAEAEQLGYQLAVHAQGDVAVHQVLTALGSVVQDGGNDLRHRVEHNALVGPDSLPLYAQYDIVATLFGYFPTCAEAAWTPFYEEIGDNPRALLDANPGGHFAWHGDDPWLEPISPLLELASMVTRAEPDRAGGFCEPPDWLERKAISVEEGLELMTTGAAYSLFRENEVGSLEVGKYADLIVISDDLTSVESMALWDLDVLITILGGDVVYCTESAEPLCSSISAEVSGLELTPPVAGDGELLETPKLRLEVSAELPDFPAEGAVDGLTDDTPWVSGLGPPQWIEFDLGAVRAVSGVRLWVDQDPAGVTRHRILGGEDPHPTDELAVLEGETSWGQKLEIQGDWQVRYLRVETVVSPSWVAWLEVKILLD